MLAQSQRESRKLGWVGDMCVWRVPLIFLVTGQCTPDHFVLFCFVFFEYRSPWCYNLFFFFKNLKEAFLRIKWPSPRLRSQGRWVYYRIPLDTPLGDHVYQGKAVRGQRGRNLALLERQCGVAFPRLPPQCPRLGTPWLWSPPCSRESQSVLLGRAKGKFGIKIPNCGKRKFKSWFYILSLSDTAWSLGGTCVYLWEINRMESQRL